MRETVVGRAQKYLEKPRRGDEFRAQGMKRGSWPWRMGGESRGEE